MGTIRYTVIDGEIMAEKRNGVRSLYVPDPLGSTVALLDNTQATTDTFGYWPYGENDGRTGTTPTPFQFVGTAGYYRDSASRTYVRARALDMQQGRWATQDPMSFDGGDNNFYVYVRNRPADQTDPTGKYNTIGCTDNQRKRIRIVIDDLCVRLKYLSLLPTNFPGLACLKSRCGLASGGHGGIIECRKPGPKCVPADKCAGTPPFKTQKIGLCPSAWDERPIPHGCGCLGSTIVHEWIHSCLGPPSEQPALQCEDFLYGPHRPRCP